MIISPSYVASQCDMARHLCALCVPFPVIFTRAALHSLCGPRFPSGVIVFLPKRISVNSFILAVFVFYFSKILLELSSFSFCIFEK